MAARLLLLFCVVIWGWTFVATKICLAYMSPIALVGLRFLIGMPLLFAVLRARRIPIAFSRREWIALSAGASIIAVHFIMQAVALTYTSATNTAWIIAVTPLALAVLSWLLLGERIGRHEIAGIAVATAGILLLVSNGNLTEFNWLRSVGDWLVLASAHTWALYTIVTRDVARARNPLSVTLVVFTPTLLLCLGYLVFRSGVWPLPALPAMALLALLFLGVLGTLTQWFWQIAVARIGGARAGVFLYLEPVATTVVAVPLLDESFTGAAAAGAVLVLAGVYWAQRHDPG